MKKPAKDDSLGARWRKTRLAAKLTQAQLAEKLEISAPYLSLIENGKRPCPGLTVVRKFHDLCGHSISYLCGEDLAS